MRARMKVTRLDTYFLSAPLPQPVSTSTHRITSVSEVVVKLTTDAGPVGIGEAHGPFLFQQGPDGLRTVSDIIKAITPLVVGQDPFDAERVWQDLFALTYTSVRGIPTLARQQRPLVTAMSAIDIALWDLKGKAIGRPVWALLGGALRRRVPAYVTGFYYRDGERPDDLVREAAMYVAQGYRTLKVKVGGLTPEADAERVGVIRKAVGKDVAIMLDANQGWNLPTAVRAATLCAPHDIFWLEDPMPWYDERRTLERLKAEVDIPIAAGETEYSPFGLRAMLAEGLVDYLIIDSTWSGGAPPWATPGGRPVAPRGGAAGDEAVQGRRGRTRRGHADASGHRHRVSRGAAGLRARLALRAPAAVLDLVVGNRGDRGRRRHHRARRGGRRGAGRRPHRTRPRHTRDRRPAAAVRDRAPHGHAGERTRAWTSARRSSSPTTRRGRRSSAGRWRSAGSDRCGRRSTRTSRSLAARRFRRAASYRRSITT